MGHSISLAQGNLELQWEHMARLRWGILVSRAQWTRPEEVDSSWIEGVDSLWLVDGNKERWRHEPCEFSGPGLISGRNLECKDEAWDEWFRISRQVWLQREMGKVVA